MLIVCCSLSSFAQVNYEAGRNLKDWTTTGDYLVDSHEWFGDTLILSSSFRYVFDTIVQMQGDTTITVVRYGSAQGIHIYPDEYLPATINLVDTAFIPITTPVLYKDKMYWGAQKSFTPPDTSAWIVLYEFDPKTLARRSLTLHDAQSGFHYMYDLEVDDGLLSAITRAGRSGDEQYYMNVVDPAQWKLVAHTPLEWTTGNLSSNSERLFTSDIKIIGSDTIVVYSGIEDANYSHRALFFKDYNFEGEELYTRYTGDRVENFWWYGTRRNYDRSILTAREDSFLFFLSNHSHPEYEDDATSPIDFKAYVIDPVTYERIASSDAMGDPRFFDVMQALMDYTTIGDTLVAVGQCGTTIIEDSTYALMGPNPIGYQLGVMGYDMNTLDLLWSKRIVAATKYQSLSDDYGVASSPHNFVSVTAMTWQDNEIDNSRDTEVRIIHLNAHGCPTGDPDKTCDELIWLDQYVSNTDDPETSRGIVPSLAVTPSLLPTGNENRIRFSSDVLSSDQLTACTLQLYNINGQILEQATLTGPEFSFAVPERLTAGIYFAYLKTTEGKSIGVGRFVLQ